MGRRDRRSNRSERRQSGKTSNEEIQFPGAMGWLQKNMKWFFVAGIVLLVASLGAPIFMSALGSDPDPQAVDKNASEATVTSSPTSSSSFNGSLYGIAINIVFLESDVFVSSNSIP